MQKRHLKPGRRGAKTGGIVSSEGFVHVSNVMLVDPRTGKPSRVRVERRGGQACACFVRGAVRPCPSRRAASRSTKRMAKKGKREKIKLESSAGTGHFYTTRKNRTNTPDKLEFKKYDPVARKHVVYKETKLKLGRRRV